MRWLGSSAAWSPDHRGDHELVLGEAVGGEVLARGAEPLGYRETGNLDGSEALYPLISRSRRCNAQSELDPAIAELGVRAGEVLLVVHVRIAPCARWTAAPPE